MTWRQPNGNTVHRQAAVFSGTLMIQPSSQGSETMNEEPTQQRLPTCPVSRTKGKVVKLETLRSLIRPEHQAQIREVRYRFCAAQDCDVVYFAENGSHVFTRAELKVRVGVKETDSPRSVTALITPSKRFLRKSSAPAPPPSPRTSGVDWIPRDATVCTPTRKGRAVSGGSWRSPSRA